jgi:hypothetical protein
MHCMRVAQSFPCRSISFSSTFGPLSFLPVGSGVYREGLEREAYHSVPCNAARSGVLYPNSFAGLHGTIPMSSDNFTPDVHSVGINIDLYVVCSMRLYISFL